MLFKESVFPDDEYSRKSPLGCLRRRFMELGIRGEDWKMTDIGQFCLFMNNYNSLE